ncbi:MAG: hypothetical protein CMF62_11100 [Magnetococcales bacterium]|nr:hypothetical protein [Magnetococcales bacterium]|tara:strand:- start:61501 stop:62043 length:543 start_codon:yes stop_codon:yes gene_type:complete
MPIDLKKYWNWKEFRFWFPLGVVLGGALCAGALNIPKENTWIDYWGMVATFLVGLAAVLIAWRQLLMMRQEQVQFEFDKKWSVYNDLVNLLVYIHRCVEKGVDFDNPHEFSLNLSSALRRYELIFGEGLGKTAIKISAKVLNCKTIDVDDAFEVLDKVMTDAIDELYEVTKPHFRKINLK